MITNYFNLSHIVRNLLDIKPINNMLSKRQVPRDICDGFIISHDIELYDCKCSINVLQRENSNVNVTQCPEIIFIFTDDIEGQDVIFRASRDNITYIIFLPEDFQYDDFPIDNKIKILYESLQFIMEDNNDNLDDNLVYGAYLKYLAQYITIRELSRLYPLQLGYDDFVKNINSQNIVTRDQYRQIMEVDQDAATDPFILYAIATYEKKD